MNCPWTPQKKQLAFGFVLVYTVFVCGFVVKWNWKSPFEYGSEQIGIPTKAENGHEKVKGYAYAAGASEPESNALDDISSYKVRFTRLGSELAFNSSTCPPNSLLRKGMLQKYMHSGKAAHQCPKLFVIGAKKGGTTSLYNYTAHHPDFQGIRLVNVTKGFGETFYFAKLWRKVPLDKYLSQFPKNKMSGDASVDNLVHCKAPMRILITCGPEVKAIVLLRDPIERFVSNFMMRVTRDSYVKYNRSTSLSSTVRLEFDILFERLKRVAHISIEDLNVRTEWSKLSCVFACCKSMIYEGLYYVFIMNWLCNFPSKNLMIINSEEMFHYPAPVLRQVFSFLGLKPLDDDLLREITSFVSNKTHSTTLPQHKLSRKDRNQLLNIYKPFDKELLDLLDWHNVSWSTK